MDWLEVAKVVTELGIMVICSAMVVTIFWLNYKRSNSKDDNKDDKLDQITKKFQQQNDEIMDKIQKQNDLLINEIIRGVTGHTLSNEENNALAQIEVQINDCLKRAQQKTNASRVYLVRYHNGNRGMDGLSFLKMSMTNESVKVGIQPTMQDFQNYFRSFLPYWVQELDEKGKCYINNIDDIKNIDNNSYEYFKNRGVQAEYGISVKNLDGCPIGFICIEYLDKSSINRDQVEKCLLDKQIKIGTLLNLKSEVNN